MHAISPLTFCGLALARSPMPSRSICCCAIISASYSCRRATWDFNRSVNRHCSLNRPQWPHDARSGSQRWSQSWSHGCRYRPFLPSRGTRGSMSEQREITSNIELLLDALPIPIRQRLENGIDKKEDLIEIIMDLGRLPEARYRDHERFLSDHEVTLEDIEFVITRIGMFGEDNRAGIPRTLHRISAIRNRASTVI